MDPVDSPPPSSLDARIYSRTSSVSEFDSPSDSDWLDISSSRESDDNDSVASDSDHERVDDNPPSRRSSISLGSSRDGDIEAWEGFVSDSADEASVVDPISVNALQIVSPAAHGVTSSTEEDIEEDQRVRDALDQSMISTLSASRSTTLSASGHHATPQGSPRDLRLSFPDPLTSSQDDLNTSFEDVSPTESAFSVPDDKEDVAAQPEEPALPTEDPGTLLTPEIPQVEVAIRAPSTCYLDVCLFGSSPSYKWTFIDNLVKKAATGSGDRAVVLSHKIAQITHAYTRTLHVQDKEHHENTPTLVVSVTDRTLSNTSRSFASSTKPTDRPCLAVIYLPATSSLPSPNEYDYYLPVLARSSADVPSLDDEGIALEAVRIWDTLSIPASKIVSLQGSEISSIIDGEYVDQLHPSHVLRVFERIAAPAESKKYDRRFTYRLNSVSAVTLFALLSVVLGFTVNTTYRWSHPQSYEPSKSIWTSSLSTTINHSTATAPKITNLIEPVTGSSMKDFALAVFNPGTNSLSEQRTPDKMVTKQSKLPDGHRQKTWFEMAKASSKDVISLPVPAAPALQQGEGSSILRPPSSKGAKAKSSDMISSISLRIPDSITPLFDFKHMLEVAEIDTKELMKALDDLATAISKQTSTILEKSLDTAKVVRDGFQYRNTRAKGKAKELRDVGEQLLVIAEEHIRVRAGMAKVKAKALKERYLSNAGWSTCSRLNKYGHVKHERKKGKKSGGGGHHRTRRLFCGSF